MGRPVRIPRVVTRAVARVKPRVPRSAWPLLLTLRSMAGNGPLVGLPRCRRALVLAAHPDDESLGCAGTIALLADTGTTVSLLVATDGEATRGSSLPPAQTAARRRAEGERSAALLGASARFLGMPDGCLTERRAELANAIARCIAELRPDIVFLPWFLDGHPDHRAVSDAFVTTVVGLAPGIEAWGYETWTPLPPNRLVDITAVVDRKRASLAAHATAHLAFDVDAGLGLARWRSMHGLLGEGYAEAFLALDAPAYADLARRTAAPGP